MKLFIVTFSELAQMLDWRIGEKVISWAIII